MVLQTENAHKKKYPLYSVDNSLSKITYHRQNVIGNSVGKLTVVVIFAIYWQTYFVSVLTVAMTFAIIFFKILTIKGI
jgi:hypothetical protein